MINSAYQYFLTEYGRTETSRYDTHKKSELKSIYNRMLATNKKSPLFNIDLSEDTTHRLIDLKENSRIFRNKLYEIFGSTDSDGELQRKSPYTSNPDILDVEYIGSDNSEPTASEYLVKVKQLAKPQVNTGDFVHSDSFGLPQGSYSFDLTVGNNAYEFQFKIGPDTTNLALQEKLAKLINRSDIGLSASVIKDANGSSALEVSSSQTGNRSQAPLFHFSDSDTNRLSGSVDFLGLNNIRQTSQDALIEVDGRPYSSSNNTFIIDKAFQLDLKSTTEEGEYVEIGFRRMPENINSELHVFADTYNKLYKLAEDSSDNLITKKLSKELSYISSGYNDVLNTIGLSKDEDGYLNVDEEHVIRSVKDGTLDNNYPELLNFQKQLINETNKISTNPFEYITKTVVAYTNPSATSYNPYQPAVYTGLLFDGAL